MLWNLSSYELRRLLSLGGFVLLSFLLWLVFQILNIDRAHLFLLDQFFIDFIYSLHYCRDEFVGYRLVLNDIRRVD